MLDLQLCLLLLLPWHDCGCPLRIAAALLCLTGNRVAAVGCIRQQGAHAAKAAVGQLRFCFVSLVLRKGPLLALTSKLLPELCIWRPGEGRCRPAPMLPLKVAVLGIYIPVATASEAPGQLQSMTRLAVAPMMRSKAWQV